LRVESLMGRVLWNWVGPQSWEHGFCDSFGVGRVLSFLPVVSLRSTDRLLSSNPSGWCGRNIDRDWCQD
jgi:hypothetical protein